MAYGSPFHWTFHRSGAATSCDVQATQAQLITNVLGKIVFRATNGMATPAYRQVRPQVWSHDIGIAQDIEYGIGDAASAVEVVANIECMVYINHVP